MAAADDDETAGEDENMLPPRDAEPIEARPSVRRATGIHGTPLANGSGLGANDSGGIEVRRKRAENWPTTDFQSRTHSASPRRIPLFERASARWWNPQVGRFACLQTTSREYLQFASPILETQYWKISFPLLRDRFRSGLIYIAITCVLWILYLSIFGNATLSHLVIRGFPSAFARANAFSCSPFL